MTGYSGSMHAHRLEAAGIREVIHKPLSSARLADCLARHMSGAGIDDGGRSKVEKG
jgi:hypothetical protein